MVRDYSCADSDAKEKKKKRKVIIEWIRYLIMVNQPPKEIIKSNN